MAITTTEYFTIYGQIFQGGDWTIPAWQSNLQLSKTVTETRTRKAVPKFREIIRNGGDATGPYSRTWFNVQSQSPCDVEVLFKYKRGGGPLVTCSGSVRSDGPWPFSGVFTFVPSTPGASYYTAARNKALSYLYQRNSEIAHAFQGGVFAGELRETWAMLKNPIKGLKDGLWGYLDDVQNKIARNKGYLQRLPKKRRTKWINDAIADSWLSFTLGFAPLAKDIDDALRALGNLSDRSESYGLTATGSANGLVSTLSYTSTTNQIACSVHQRSIEECSVRFKAGIRLTPPQADTTQSMQGQLSLTLADFVPTVWNLLPGSFLYDYVTNIGDVLDAYSNPIIGLVYCSETVKTLLTATISTLVDNDRTAKNFGSAFVAVGGECGAATAVSGRFERRIAVGNLVPSFQVSIDLSDRQLLNVAALLQKGNLVKLLSFGLIK